MPGGSILFKKRFFKSVFIVFSGSVFGLTRPFTQIFSASFLFQLFCFFFQRKINMRVPERQQPFLFILALDLHERFQSLKLNSTLKLTWSGHFTCFLSIPLHLCTLLLIHTLQSPPSDKSSLSPPPSPASLRVVPPGLHRP